jgi:hypothetical protein
VTLAAALFLAGAFAWLLGAFQLPERGAEALALARRVPAVLVDAALDDGAKEQQMRALALRLFALCAGLVVRGAAALLIPIAALAILDEAGLLSLRSALALGASWPFLLGTSGALVVLHGARLRRLRAGP